MIGSVNVPGASGFDLRQVVVTLNHAKTGTVHAFAGLGDRSGLVPCQFKSTAGYTESDTATIDGTAYTITLTGADAPETDLFVSGKSILVDVDTEAKTINFRSGGGLTKGKLALANANEDTVFNGRTFYAGEDKTMRTGTALSQATTASAGDITSGKTAYNNLGQLITGTAKHVQAGTVYPVAEKTYTINYDNSLGTPKLVIAWFGTDSINSFSPYLFAGAATGNHAGTSLAGGSGNFRNQNQSMANSTYYIGTSYFSFTVDKYDYLSGGSYECSYIFVW